MNYKEPLLLLNMYKGRAEAEGRDYNYSESGRDDYVTVQYFCIGVSSDGLLLCNEAISWAVADNFRVKRRALYSSLCHY